MTAAKSESEVSLSTPEETLTNEVLFDAISNGRRREVIRTLDAETVCELSDLSLQIAAMENDSAEAEVTGQQRKRVYVGLYQSHLPKLDRHGIIVFDRDKGTIRRGEKFQTVARVLEAANGARENGDPDDGLVGKLLGGVFA